MEEIEVGDFVRLDDGTIGKYNINKNWINVVETNNQYIGFDIEKDIVKHSKNIIDLIEVGDYVNGKLVSNVDKVDNTNFIEWDDGDMYKTEISNDKFIKSIVTHEQFTSMEYKVEEN